MLLKLTGAVLVVAAGAAVGLYYSMLDVFRAQNLSEFRKALLILASEIEYIALPLPEAVCGTVARTTGFVRRLFSDFAEQLRDNRGETASDLWAASLNRYKNDGFLTPEDWEMLASLGRNLGCLDKQMQLNNIRLAADYIENILPGLRDTGEKNKRMYRSLGVLGGMLLAVVIW